MMSSGFFNDLRVSVKEGWRCPLQSVITVHDSNTCLLPTEMIFDIRKFYDINFTEFCAKNASPHIRLLFDLLSGKEYESACDMKQIDEDTIEFKGSADSILKIYDKIMNCKYVKATCSMKREDIVPSYVTDAMQRFIIEEGTSIKKDESSYRVQFHRERV